MKITPCQREEFGCTCFMPLVVVCVYERIAIFSWSRLISKQQDGGIKFVFVTAAKRHLVAKSSGVFFFLGGGKINLM